MGHSNEGWIQGIPIEQPIFDTSRTPLMAFALILKAWDME